MKHQKHQKHQQRRKPRPQPKGEIVKVISEWKHSPRTIDPTARNRAIKPGHKRVQAIVQMPWGKVTRHVDVTR